MDQSIKVLTSQKRHLEQEIATLQARLARVVAAIDALTASDIFDQMNAAYVRRRRPAGTLKQMAFTALYEQDSPMTAQAILKAIDEKFGVEILRTSMSPQLSRLGQDEILLRHGNLWTINPDRPKEADHFYLLKAGGDLI